ncbi:MAG TPA: flagellin [Solirubrobacteraceae bacterium]|nr:flagellin [Solirubrobacteraceae bacterium]
MATRITTSMVQRNVLADLNAISAKLTKTQMKASSNKEISRPSDDPFNASRAMALRQNVNATKQYQRNVEDAMGWMDASEQAMDRITEAIRDARDLLIQGGSDSTDQTSREAIATELEQLIESVKQNASATYRGSFLFSGGETGVRPYMPGADDTYHGDDGGLNPATPGIVREIGPGVTMTINTVASDMLGVGTGDDKLLDVLRDAVGHLRAGDGASVRTTDLTRLDANLDHVLEVRAANGARTNRLEAAMTRLAEVHESTVKQLSSVEDADIAETLISLNSQTAAYQAALRAGASIVQTSLMDFLR